MLIKNGKEATQIEYVSLGILVIAGLIFATETTISLVIGIFGLGMFLFVRSWIAIDRTIFMEEDGCTISFWKYKKKYRWSDFSVKEIRRCQDAPNRMSPTYYKKCVVLSVKAIHKPKWFSISRYNGLIRPFSLIVIYFQPKQRKGEKPIVFIYEVEEDKFRECMKTWNVAIEETEKREFISV